MFEIVKSLEETDRYCDFVAIGYEGAAIHSHAAIIIKFRSKLYQFDFMGEVELAELENDFLHKITDTIESSLVPSFYAYCRRVKKFAKPKFVFFIPVDIIINWENIFLTII